MDAQHVGKLFNQLFVPSSDFPPILHVIINVFVSEVRFKAVLNIHCKLWNLQIQHEKWFVCCWNILGPFNMEFRSETSTQDVSDQTWLEKMFLILLNWSWFKAFDLAPIIFTLQICVGNLFVILRNINFFQLFVNLIQQATKKITSILLFKWWVVFEQERFKDCLCTHNWLCEFTFSVDLVLAVKVSSNLGELL